MSSLCKDNKHVWTVTSCDAILAPYMNLTPATRCHCGACVIVQYPGGDFRESLLLTAKIDSPQVARIVELSPKFKTW